MACTTIDGGYSTLGGDAAVATGAQSDGGVNRQLFRAGGTPHGDTWNGQFVQMDVEAIAED